MTQLWGMSVQAKLPSFVSVNSTFGGLQIRGHHLTLACNCPPLAPQIIFDEALKRGPSSSPAQMVRLSEQFPKEAPRPVPERGTVTIAAGADFPQQFSEFSFRTLLTKVGARVCAPRRLCAGGL